MTALFQVQRHAGGSAGSGALHLLRTCPAFLKEFEWVGRKHFVCIFL